MVFVNGKIYTMAGELIECGFVRTNGSKISAVGGMEDYQPIANEEVLDAAGAGIYPGFVDAHSHLGICEDSIGQEGEDSNEETDPITPQLRALDAINPLERGFSEALEAGVTTVVVSPGSANPIAGQICALKTKGVCVDDMLVKETVAMKFALGENPKSVYREHERGPFTRMATAALIREQLAKAQRYLEDKQAAKEDDELEEPEYNFQLEALLPVLRREVKAHFHCHRADDICTAIRLAKEFELDYVLIHCTEGHLVAQKLAEQGVSAVVGPLVGWRRKPELAGMTPDNPALLHQSGVKTAICTDHPELTEPFLPLSAALAVRGGLPYDEALRAITLYPAQICGIADRVGSLEPGKDADFVLFFGDPLSVYARPKLIVLDGQIHSRA